MDPLRIVYYAMIISALCLCIKFSGHDKNIKIFIPLFILSLIAEAIGDINALKGTNKMIVYHIFLPIEYFFISTYFANFWRTFTISKIINVSFVFFAMLSLWMSSLKGLNSFPGMQFNIEGVLNMTLAMGALLFLPVQDEEPLYKLTIFWISIGLIIYHSTIFVMNGCYNYLLNTNPDYITKLTRGITYSANIIYYLCFSIAFICCRTKKK